MKGRGGPWHIIRSKNKNHRAEGIVCWPLYEAVPRKTLQPWEVRVLDYPELLIGDGKVDSGKGQSMGN